MPLDAVAQLKVLDSAWLAYALAKTGQRTAAQESLRAVVREPRDVYNLHAGVAAAYAALGDRDEAFRSTGEASMRR